MDKKTNIEINNKTENETTLIKKIFDLNAKQYTLKKTIKRIKTYFEEAMIQYPDMVVSYFLENINVPIITRTDMCKYIL